jgi:hypothetical protein
LRDVVEGVGSHLCGGLIVVFGGLPRGVWGGAASGGVNDYAQLWLGFGVGFSGCIGVYTQRWLVANFSYLFGYSWALRDC